MTSKTHSFETNAWEEHEKIDQQMRDLQEELQELCRQGNCDEAVRRSDEEMRPLHKRWFDTLIQSYDYLKNHPNFYKPE